MLRKLALAGALVVLAVLAGCGGLGTAGAILSGSVANPITPKMAYQLHAGFTGGVVVVAGNYAALPRCSRAPQPCSEQTVVTTLRVYVNSAEGLLDKLDAWALGNTSLDGPALYQAAKIAIATATNYALANGVK